MAIEHDLVVITDEVYEHLTFAGHEHVPIATLPGMAERTLTLSSAGKTYSFTGWKVGWATGPAELVGAVLAAKQWLTFTSGAPLQPAVARCARRAPRLPGARWPPSCRSKRDLLCAGLAKVGLPGPTARGHLLRHHRHHPPRLAGRDGVLPGAARAGRRGGHPDPGVLRRPGRAAGTWSAGRSARRRSVIEEALSRLARLPDLTCAERRLQRVSERVARRWAYQSPAPPVNSRMTTATQASSQTALMTEPMADQAQQARDDRRR